MATILTLAASFLGLITAIIAMVLFDASFLTALTMWFASGVSTTILALIWSTLPQRRTTPIRA